MLCLTETWIKPDEYIILNESTPQEYCYKNEPHPKCKGGGFAIIYSNILSISQRAGFTYNFFEVMVLLISLSKETILSLMEFWFLAAVTSGLLSWGHLFSSDIV